MAPRKADFLRNKWFSDCHSTSNAHFQQLPAHSYHGDSQLTDSEQMEKIWVAISRQGIVIAELLLQLSVSPSLPAPLRLHGTASTNLPQEDILSITASEEVVKQEVAFLSEDMESDGMSPTVKLSLSAELIPLIKRATATLQVPWPTASPIFSPVYRDFLYEIQSYWDHPATAPALSRTMDALYRVYDVEKLGLAHFPLVEASIADLVQAPNLTLLSKDAACPNKQCQVSEVILKRAYSAGVFSAWLGNYNSILVAYYW
ncbi:UNVERIFIED_CONTAM: hypothetical protein FKN15_011515 [Acipenser sinensis]